MLKLALFLDRIRPEAVLAVALIVSVAWVGCLTYALLRIVG
jgi:hypothetical protein